MNSAMPTSLKLRWPKGLRACEKRKKGERHASTGSASKMQGRAPTSKLVLHRIVEITADDRGEKLLITRGDSMTEPDKPWNRKQLMGVAVSLKRLKNEYPVRIFMPPSGDINTIAGCYGCILS
jgi:hypothetical protein